MFFSYLHQASEGENRGVPKSAGKGDVGLSDWFTRGELLKFWRVSGSFKVERYPRGVWTPC
ncbi:conserved hypothetical protein [Ricinus communis]|uniref:Uncharacterized protein n=1 Tax=Ricinus communis TaxID=3988 RepID=B9RK27_RICCO|nr:conserved hypothetical protein [Ricinus communis]